MDWCRKKIYIKNKKKEDKLKNEIQPLKDESRETIVLCVEDRWHCLHTKTIILSLPIHRMIETYVWQTTRTMKTHF